MPNYTSRQGYSCRNGSLPEDEEYERNLELTHLLNISKVYRWNSMV